jgi:hypothetical protein
LRENLCVKFLAPEAPVGASKIEQQEFVVRLRLLLRFFVIVEPAKLGVGQRRRKKKTGYGSEKNQTMIFHVATFDQTPT